MPYRVPTGFQKLNSLNIPYYLRNFSVYCVYKLYQRIMPELVSLNWKMYEKKTTIYWQRSTECNYNQWVYRIMKSICHHWFYSSESHVCGLVYYDYYFGPGMNMYSTCLIMQFATELVKTPKIYFTLSRFSWGAEFWVLAFLMGGKLLLYFSEIIKSHTITMF
jgi:hypothetical protein